jgi:PAS domain-containing protein/mono/diheme cytochrome c family protein
MTFRVSILATLLALRSAGAVDFAKEIRPVLETYCFKCHGAEKQKGGVKLHETGDLAALYGDAGLWDKVLTELRDEAMPPEDKPQPSAEERQRVIAWLTQTLTDPDLDALPRDPGRPFLHRLSRVEYNNTMRDLLGVDTRPADEFPPDGGGGGGFDNNSATLFIPPVLMEKYLGAAAKVLAEAKPERVITAQPGDALAKNDAARRCLADFATRAFRRPAEPAEIEALLPLFAQAEARGASFDDAIRFALRAVLVSPHFLFRLELPRASEPHPLNDHELASRLSYFLWSSMPDDELFRLAREGKLHEPATLEEQTRRMLLDPKARAFAENFAGQWLRVHELMTSAQPDAGEFPDFTPALRDAMAAEPIEFFHALLREDGSLLRILDADYTYANQALAKLYGLDEVKGDDFQRVALHDRNRGGVLTMGAVLTLTSYPRRSSPVLRGKWVLEQILGTPPPPPPPLIKSLPPSDKVRDGLTFRQQLERHRKDDNCAGCHKRMDPLGFGLENFDAIGRYRTTIQEQTVDASGEMVTGEKFSGPAELKTVLLTHKDEFIRNVTAKMFAYALNRGLESYDVPIVRHTAKTLAASDYRIDTLIMEIVKSYPFQNRRGTSAVAALR